jgi:hypothetical protein
MTDAGAISFVEWECCPSTTAGAIANRKNVSATLMYLIDFSFSRTDSK